MRTTNDKKEGRIVIRLNEADYEWVKSRAESTTEYIRRLIAKDRFEKTKSAEEPKKFF